MADVFIDPTAKKVYGGDAWSQPYYFGDFELDADGNAVLDESGEPVGTREDLSTYGGWAAQWRTAANADEAITLTVDATDAATGVLLISATSAQTRAMGANGVFDIQASTPEVRTFVRGKTKWTLDVTRD
jgi:hypothetical protein